MFHRVRSLAVQLVACVTLSAPALAGPTMDQVSRTGLLIGGTSRDAFPFAYEDESGKLVGYSVDILDRIRLELEKKTGRPIRLQLVPLAPDERIARIQSGEVNIICDASSFTWKRDQTVDFSVSYGITGTQLLVPNDSSISSPESIAGKRVGVLPGTTNALAIQKAQPAAQLVFLDNREAGYQALREGTIDAFAGDGLLLYAWLQRQETRPPFRVAADPYSKEGIACMVPDDDSAFQGTVNLALVRFMDGVLNGDPESLRIFDRWFGPESATPLTRDLRSLFIETMQLMVDLKEEPPTAR